MDIKYSAPETEILYVCPSGVLCTSDDAVDPTGEAGDFPWGDQ